MCVLPRQRQTPCFLIGILLIGLSGSSLRAQPVKSGPEFQVNTYTSGTQAVPAVAMDNSGKFVVVWTSREQDGSGEGVFGQRFSNTGAFLGSEFQVNSYTTDVQQIPAVAMDASGDFVVVWEGTGQVVWHGILGQRFDSAGTPLGGEFQVNSFTTYVLQDPAVAMDGSGNFVVVWEGPGQGDLRGIFGQRFDGTGTPLGGEFRVNTTTAGYQLDPAVAMDGLGNFVVVWDSADQDGSDWGVFGRRFSNSGAPLGGEFQVNTYTTDNQGTPAIAMTILGDFVVAWASSGQDGSDYGVFGQRFHRMGTPVGNEFQVNTTTSGRQAWPAVSIDGVGSFVVAWTSYGQDGSDYGVFGQRFDSAGTALGGEFQVNTFTAGAQGGAPFPSLDLTMADSGDFVTVWHSAGQDDPLSELWGVFGQRFLGCAPHPGQVTDLEVVTASGGAYLVFNWTDTTDADDYALFEDALPDGPFSTLTGVSTSGVSGLTIPTPPGTTYYLLAGRNATCGIGPIR